MLGLCAGVVVFILLLVSKYALSHVLIKKKQVALSLITIVTSELSLVLLIYISIDKFGLSGIRIITGFLLATLASFALYGLKKILSAQSKQLES